MKQAVIIHGWDGRPEGNWFPWLKRELEARGYEVSVPCMPNTATPYKNEWLDTLKDIVINPNEDTVLIGHSLGCISILQYVETLQDPQLVGKVILVAGFIRSLDNPVTDDFFVEDLDSLRVRQHIKTLISISSDDDPYVPAEQAALIQDQLEPETLVLHDAGHINVETGYTELPEIIQFL